MILEHPTMTPDDVEALFRVQPASEGEAAVAERTASLQGALDVLTGLSGSQEGEMAAYVDKLANGSRDGESAALLLLRHYPTMA